MKDVFLNQVLPGVLPVLITGIVAVIAAIIKTVGDVVIEYINKKKQVVEQTLQLDKHAEELETAKEVWNIIEEKYRLTDKINDLAANKANDFDKLLLKNIPYLTSEQVQMLRQTIAGEFNKGKELFNKDDIKQQAKELLDKNNKLESENIELKNKLDAISNYVPKEQGQ